MLYKEGMQYMVDETDEFIKNHFDVPKNENKEAIDEKQAMKKSVKK